MRKSSCSLLALLNPTPLCLLTNAPIFPWDLVVCHRGKEDDCPALELVRERQRAFFLKESFSERCKLCLRERDNPFSSFCLNCTKRKG